jgi:hypothetical protein
MMQCYSHIPTLEEQAAIAALEQDTHMDVQMINATRNAAAESMALYRQNGEEKLEIEASGHKMGHVGSRLVELIEKSPLSFKGAPP